MNYKESFVYRDKDINNLRWIWINMRRWMMNRIIQRRRKNIWILNKLEVN
jgi:hypothetical protein